MSPPSEHFPPALVVVIDTSVLIQFKKLVPVAQQWDRLSLMGTLLDSGDLCFPRQVPRELEVAQFPDAPGAWAAHCKHRGRHRQPPDEAVAEVLGVAPLLVDSEAEAETADPYVAAMAWDIRERHDEAVRVVVATNDFVERLPRRQSLAGACATLGIEAWKPDRFVEWLSEME